MKRTLIALGSIILLAGCGAAAEEGPPPLPPPPPALPPTSAPTPDIQIGEPDPASAAPGPAATAQSAQTASPSGGPLPPLPSQAPMAPNGAPAPASPSAAATQPPETEWVRPYPNGQWVYTAENGWIWVPAATSTVVMEGVPYVYLYTPSYGWTWYVSPWGPGAYQYGVWVRHPWHPAGWNGRWVAHPHVVVRLGPRGGYHGGYHGGGHFGHGGVRHR